VTARRIALASIALLAFPAAASATTVLPRGSVWKYEDSGVALAPEWKDAGYDDGTWSAGPAPLGYGDPYIVTTVSYGGDPNDKHITTYFRTTFDLQDPPASIQTLLLNANYDDGLVVYLNGQEVARPSMPAGAIDFQTLAFSHEGGGYEPLDISTHVALLVPTGNVLAVEAHQSGPTSSDLGMDVEVETSTQSALITRGPYLQIGTPTGVTVRWRTSGATDSRVRYGPAPGQLDQMVDDPALLTEHEVAITGLQPDTGYFYSVGTTAASLAGGADYHFRTPPVPGTRDPVRAWVIGDSGQPGANQRAVRDAYLAHPGAADTDLWLMLGDNAYSTGTDPEYEAAVFDAYPSLLRTVALWPTRGNHDYLHAGTDNDYLEIFSLPAAGQAGGVPSGTESYYSFDWANVHFVCLDSEGSDRTSTGPMISWLRQDLAANTQDWTIAFWHHPPYTKGSHDSDNVFDSGGRMRDMRENVLPVADSLGVDLVLTGHSHSYERSFLLDGHYGTSGTLTPEMILDGGDGRIGGDGAYSKATLGSALHEGSVYVVAGSSSKISGGALNHPVMVASFNVLGSVVLDVAGSRLDAAFLDDTGTVRDSFTMVKGPATDAPVATAAPAMTVRAEPNPFSGGTSVRFTLPQRGAARVRVVDAQGRLVRTLAEGERASGSHTASWDGRDERGRAVAAGVYFVTLEHGGSVRATKVVRTR